VRILFVTQYFEPEPLVKGLLFARALVARGHEVQVLTGFPNYPGGRLYGGYRIRAYQTELMDGVRVHRVPLYPDHSQSVLRRGANYLSYAMAAATLGPFVTFRPDVIYVYHSPATLAVPAIAVKLFKRSRIVSDIQDLWPDTVYVAGLGDRRMLLKPLDWFCNVTYRAADRLVVPAPSLKRILVERGIRREAIELIYNWAADDVRESRLTREMARSNAGWTADQFVVLFAGTMGLMQALDSVLDAARLLKERAPRIVMAFIGGGIDADRLAARAAAEALTNVRFHARVSPAEIGTYLQAADALLVHLKKEPLYEALIPSKTQAYMAAARPVLMAVAGDAAELVTTAGCGVVAEPQNAESIARAVEQMAALPADALAQMGRNGRAFYEREMSLETGVSRFDQLFRAVANAR
jgi:glycosyltransferase involved in cell wall biosynthesis